MTLPPPISDQFVQRDRRNIYGGNVSYMIRGNIFGFDVQNAIGIIPGILHQNLHEKVSFAAAIELMQFLEATMLGC